MKIVLPLILPLLAPLAFAQAPGNRESYNSGVRNFMPARPQVYDLSTAFASSRHLLLLPPETPVLGAPLPAVQGAAATGTPAELLPLRRHVFEPFYGPLAMLLSAGDLAEDRRRALDSYTAARDAALAELRAKLDSLRQADAARRSAELTDFAARQAPALAGLERTAGQLHATFMRDASVLQGVEWQNLRQVKLARDAEPGSLADEWNLVISAAFFHEGLSSEQRLLLREMTQELARSLRPSPSPAAAARSFSPFTARVELPSDLPPALGRKLEAYEAAKAALKRELREKLYAHDLEFWSARRTEALRALAAKQADEFAALERLAEEIRRDLAGRPRLLRPAGPGLTAEVTQRISAYLVAKSGWQRTMVRKLAELRGRHPEAQVEFATLDGRPRIEVTGSLASGESDALADFNRIQQDAFAALGREREELNRLIAGAARDGAGAGQARSVDQLLEEFGRELGRLDLQLRYRDYETAVLEPGLSPEQRRLLFGAALEQFELPLVPPAA